MDVKYFKKEGKELLEGKIPVKLLGDSGEVFYEIALEMVGAIEENNKKGEDTVFILPVGPVGQYPIFVRLVNERRINLRRCWFINMDEYLTDEKKYIDEEDTLSFRGFMQRNVYSKIDPDLLPPLSRRVFPDPENTEYISNLVAELGKIDIAFVGIGINGHLAFNEAEDVPAEEFALRPTRVLRISRETRAVNSIGDLNGALDAMPVYAVTIGMDMILKARKVRLGIFRPWHRAVLRQAIFSEMGGHFPVTLLQKHPDALIYVNNVAAERPF